MKLNLGCGFRKKDGFVNVDLASHCESDVVCDLAREKWPWENSSVEEVHFEFSLEQMGETRQELFHVIKELYRVAKHECKVNILCLHPRHDQFVNDPLNTHRLSVEFFQFLSMKQNLAAIGQGQLGHSWALENEVNFEMAGFTSLLDHDIHAMMTSGQISEDQVRTRMRFENNICRAYEIRLSVVKIR